MDPHPLRATDPRDIEQHAQLPSLQHRAGGPLARAEHQLLPALLHPCHVLLHREDHRGNLSSLTLQIIAIVIYSSAYLYCRAVYLNMLDTGEGLDTYFRYSLAIHIFGWLAQFFGHGVFEGRSPALMDNLLLIFVAPFFVISEVSGAHHLTRY